MNHRGLGFIFWASYSFRHVIRNCNTQYNRTVFYSYFTFNERKIIMKEMFKKAKRGKKTKSFFNKKVNDLTVGETVAYGAVCSVVAIAISLVPLAVIDIKEKLEDNKKPLYDPSTGIKINYADVHEEVEEV